jgi:hypothetical protein
MAIDKTKDYNSADMQDIKTGVGAGQPNTIRIASFYVEKKIQGTLRPVK